MYSVDVIMYMYNAVMLMYVAQIQLCIYIYRADVILH